MPGPLPDSDSEAPSQRSLALRVGGSVTVPGPGASQSRCQTRETRVGMIQVTSRLSDARTGPPGPPQPRPKPEGVANPCQCRA